MSHLKKALTLPALGLLIEVRKRQNQGEFMLKVWNYGLIVWFAFCHFCLYSPALICCAEQVIRMKLAFIQCVIKLRFISAVGFSVICLITFNHHFAWNMQYLDLCGWRRAFMFAILLKCSPWGVMRLKIAFCFPFEIYFTLSLCSLQVLGTHSWIPNGRKWLLICMYRTQQLKCMCWMSVWVLGFCLPCIDTIMCMSTILTLPITNKID